MKTCRLVVLVLGVALAAAAEPPTGEDDPVFVSVPEAPDTVRLLADLKGRLGQADQVRGVFVQTKRIRALRRPLVSRGEFLVLGGTGVVWRTLSPFESTFVVTPTRLVQVDASGKRQTLETGGRPEAATFTTLMLNLFDGNLEGLGDSFTLHVVEGDTGWRLGLVPDDERMSRIIRYVVIGGVDGEVRSMRLVETVGDSTETAFDKVQSGRGILNADDHAWFSP